MPVTRQIKERLRKDAAERQTVYDALSIQEKLAKLPAAPACKRQREKLEKLLPQSAAETAEPVTAPKTKKSGKFQ